MREGFFCNVIDRILSGLFVMGRKLSRLHCFPTPCLISSTYLHVCNALFSLHEWLCSRTTFSQIVSDCMAEIGCRTSNANAWRLRIHPFISITINAYGWKFPSFHKIFDQSSSLQSLVKGLLHATQLFWAAAARAAYIRGRRFCRCKFALRALRQWWTRRRKLPSLLWDGARRPPRCAI